MARKIRERRNQGGKHRKTIKGKILFCMSLTLAAALAVLGGASIWLNYTSSIGLLEQLMTETAQISSERVAQELNAYKNVAIDAGVTPSICDPEQSTVAKKRIIDQRAAEHGFQRGNIIGADGVSIFDGNDYSDRAYYQAAMQGRASVSDPLISKITGQLSIMIAAPMWQGGVSGSRVIGVVYFVPPETFLNDIVSQMQVSEHGAAYAINANGVTIADNTMETIATQNIEEEAKADPSLRELAAIHALMRQGGNGFAPYQINGVKKFSAYAPIEGTDGWSIGITAPQTDFMGSTYFAIGVTAVIMLASVLIACFIAFRLASGIGTPIRLCALRLNELAQGDLQTAVPQIRRNDELGLLGEATDTIVSTMKGIILDLEYGLGEIASGNLTADSKAKELYVGDFQALAASLYRIIAEMTEALWKVNQGANLVSTSSEQISSGSQALSQGATEQASSVEELAATINEISAQVRQMAEDAADARGKSELTGGAVETSNRQMQEMVAAMDEISEKSGQIGKIIKTIEDIAFQTNILALNAAVEAARAGAAGKGFAVVADEVRNLASKSAEASKGTADLIDSTVRAVEKGTKILHETAESLTRVSEDVAETVLVVDKIAAAADGQAEIIAQVTQGVNEISTVVQTNSATAEEAAAASEELSGQALMLRDLVGQFKLKEAGAAQPGLPGPGSANPAAPAVQAGKY